VAWYGRLTGDKTSYLTSHPLDKAAALKAPTLGLYAGEDAGISQTSVEAMKAALAAQTGNAAAQASQFVVYPGVPHAFHADYRPTYREKEAKDGWQRALAWFRQHGVA
jgi:carboxymethylenebutenolidase